jgi:adenosylcobinamide kinase / adenosylcobinamide-phosphate guanylyltransferase
VITLVLGGTRSGKSGVAEAIAARREPPVIYIATGSAAEDDAHMSERIAHHRARRPPHWQTIEAGLELCVTLRQHVSGTALVDSLGTWVAAHGDLAVDTEQLLDALWAREGSTVIVSDEVGLSVHPPTAVGRRFVDVLGDVNQAVAAVADEVLLVVAGRVLRLDRLT